MCVWQRLHFCIGICIHMYVYNVCMSTKDIYLLFGLDSKFYEARSIYVVWELKTLGYVLIIFISGKLWEIYGNESIFFFFFFFYFSWLFGRAIILNLFLLMFIKCGFLHKDGGVMIYDGFAGFSFSLLFSDIVRY